MDSFSPVVLYLGARFIAGSHWQGGDYSYNILKLPFNIIGNLLGYLMITVFGTMALPAYEKLRDLMKANIPLAAIISLIVVGVMYFVYKKYLTSVEAHDKKIIYFCLFFFACALLPFLGLGNITSRYSYLASLGIIMLIVFFGQKLYQVLLKSGREIAIGAVVLLGLVFALFHIIEVQQMQGDYRTAGSYVQNFFVGIDNAYSDYWSEQPVELHFVDIPIKTGEAWVFPVGLPDALWFAFQNPDLQIFNDATVDQAVGSGTSDLRKVFQFQGDGIIKEISRPVLIPNTNTPEATR